MINPAITAAILAASNQEEVEEKIEARLRKSNALGSSSAIRLELSEQQQKLLDQAVASGSVVRTIDGRFHLSERAVADRKEGQGFMALLILLVIASLIASVAVLAVRAS